MAENVDAKLSREELARQLEELKERNRALEEQLSGSESHGQADGGSNPETSKRPRGRVFRVVRKVFFALLVTAAAVTLIVSYAFPVMRIYGSSMSSTLVDGDIVIAKKTTALKQGDICAFYSGSRMLCKRVIGVGGDEITIDKEGTVFVNGEELDEPYLKGKSLGDSDVEYPVVVPQNSYFVLGDNRRTSIDSRNSVIGCISDEQVVGKLLFCILPLPSFGTID